MRNLKRTYLFTVILIASLLLSCSKENDPKPDDNIPFEVGGSITAVVNGEKKSFPNAVITEYPRTGQFEIIGGINMEEGRRERVTIRLPLAPATGTFEHGSNGYYIGYAIRKWGTGDLRNFARLDATGEINVTEFKVIGTDGEDTYYSVKGRFNRTGRDIQEDPILGTTLDVRDGEFEAIFYNTLE